MSSTAQKVLLWFSALFSSVPVLRQGDGFAGKGSTCRICFQELRGDAFKTECCCKGDLAIGHEECIRKWFSVKGNNICDVCRVEVKNLSITPGFASTVVQHCSLLSRICNIFLMFFGSTLAYFCLLEKILVRDAGIACPLFVLLPIAICIAILLFVLAPSRESTNYTWRHALSYISVTLPFLYVSRDSQPSLLLAYVVTGVMLEFWKFNSMRCSQALLRLFESILADGIN